MSAVIQTQGGVSVQDMQSKAAPSVEAQRPWGRPVTSVQPHPTPLVAGLETGHLTAQAAQQADPLRQQAQARSELSGLGGIVDVIV